MTYDTLGNVRSIIDDRSPAQTTNITYSETFAKAYPTQIQKPLSQTVGLNYDFNTGLLTATTDVNNQTTSFSYDDMNRPTVTTFPGGGCTEAAYPTQAPWTIEQYVCLFGTTKRHDQITLDSLARVTKNRLLDGDPEGDTDVDTTYDTSGRVESVTNPYRSTTERSYGLDSFLYDGLNRVRKVTHSDGNFREVFYGAAVGGGGGQTSQLCDSGTDRLGYPTLLKDEADKKRQTWTDALGRVIELDEPDSGGSLTLNTCYKYDALDNLIQLDHGSQTRTYAYDALSRLTADSTPEGGVANYYYTTAGGALCAGDPNALCRKTDARSITITYTYDALNRLTSKDYSDTTANPDVTFAYDETSYGGKSLTNTKGRLSHTTTVDPSGGSIRTRTIHSYDAVGRIKDYWQCTPYNCPGGTYWQTTNTYNLAGDLTNWTHPAGYTFTHTVNVAQRVTKVESSLDDSTHPGTLADITYYPFGAVRTLLNGCVGTGCTRRNEVYTYNSRLQLEILRLGTETWHRANYCFMFNYYPGVSLPTTCLGYPSSGSSGNNGNVVDYYLEDNTSSPTPDMDHTATYTYDALNRLTNSTATGSQTHNLTFGYDRYGNASCQPGGSPYCTQMTFASSNRIATIGGWSMPADGYDGAGNQKKDDLNCNYTWDAEGRLTAVTGCATASYVYNALGQRVEKLVSSAYTEYVYDAFGNVISHHNRSNWLRHIIPLGGRPLARYQDGVTYFIHASHLGSTTFLTNHAGDTTQKLLLLPYGQRWASGGSIRDERFASLEERDSETTLDPTLFRMYHSRLYRWLSPDPVAGDIFNPQSLNRYAYVMNNPTNLTDPLGLQSGNPFCSDLYYAVSHAECRDLPPGPSNPFPPPGWLPPLCIGCWFGSDEGGGESAKAPAAVGGSEVIWQPDLLKPPPEELIESILRDLYRASACMTVGGIVVALGPRCAEEVLFGLAPAIVSFTSADAAPVWALRALQWLQRIAYRYGPHIVSWLDALIRTKAPAAVGRAREVAGEFGKEFWEDVRELGQGIDPRNIQRALEEIRRQQLNGTWESGRAVPRR